MTRIRKSIAVGETVAISSGPFAGHIVPVQSVNGTRARVLLALFGQPQEIEISLEALEAA